MAKRDDDESPKVKLKYKVPKAIGAAIDLLFKVRSERKAAEAKGKLEKAQESLIEAAIFGMFGKSELEGAKGKSAQASIKRSDVPTIKDWKKFWAYVKKNDAEDLVRRQVSVDAFRQRLANKKVVPGVEVFTKVSLSLTKRK